MQNAERGYQRKSRQTKNTQRDELDTPLTLSKISNNQPSSNYYTEGKILNIKCKIQNIN